MKLTHPLVVIDFEATATDPRTARIVEFFAFRLDPNGMKHTLECLINPGVPILNNHIHGITDEMVKDALPFRDAAENIRRFIFGSDLAGYNLIGYDFPLLQSEFGRNGMAFLGVEPFPDEILVTEDSDYSMATDINCLVDPLAIFRARYPKGPHKLQNAWEYYYPGKECPAKHRAKGDVAATFKILEAQAAKVDFRGWQSLMSDTVAKFADSGLWILKDGLVCCLGKHAGRPLTEIWRTNPGDFNWLESIAAQKDKKIFKGVKGGLF